ncbi:MAG: TetR family transcriptional regulator [Myxococcota bacterium]
MAGKERQGRRVQRRGDERREAIAAAAVEVIARAGTHAVTHRAVAKQAGVPLGATTYYFTSKEDLLTAAFRYLAEREIAEIALGLEQIPQQMSPQLAAAITASFVASDVRNKRMALLVQMELYLEASRRVELREVARRLDRVSLDLCEQLVERAGSTWPEVDGGLLLSVITGLELGELANPTDSFERDIATPLFHRFFERICGSAE